MTQAATDDAEATDSAHGEPDSANTQTNFGWMALYQIVLRTGWIFKTESIVMPAVLDTIAGPGWLRGCLPMLNRMGQSIPPVLASGRVHSAPRKKRVLAFCSLMMGVSFWALACLWLFAEEKPAWLPAAFLLFYGIFFASTGINQLTLGTLHGKLIPVNRRGRLMLVSHTVGAMSAVTCAWLLLRLWLREDEGNFFAIFGFAGTCFVLAAAIGLLLVEQSDVFPKTSMSAIELFRVAARTLADDANFRLLAIVASLFGMSLTLFPHYQALGRQRLELGLDQLMPWVIAQNLGLAVCSIPTGWMADRFGNRLVLRLLLVVLCCAPLLALELSRLEELGGTLYFLVFCLLGLTPITIRTLHNYCLELAPRADQPRYLSTLGLCMAGPAIFTSVLLGGLVDVVGFEPVFLFVVGCLILGLLLTRRLVDPRHASES